MMFLTILGIVVRSFVRVPRLYIRGDWFSIVARAMSVVLAFAALLLGVVFLAVLPASGGRLTLGDGLTFVGFLLTAASFFATAGKPDGEGRSSATWPQSSDPDAPNDELKRKVRALLNQLGQEPRNPDP
jgi:hypothetical protein